MIFTTTYQCLVEFIHLSGVFAYETKRNSYMVKYTLVTLIQGNTSIDILELNTVIQNVCSCLNISEYTLINDSTVTTYLFKWISITIGYTQKNIKVYITIQQLIVWSKWVILPRTSSYIMCCIIKMKYL